MRDFAVFVLFLAISAAGKGVYAAPYHYENPGYVSVQSFSSVERRRIARRLASISETTADRTLRTLSPIAFGADPTGTQDSSSAMIRMITYLTQNVSSVRDDSGHVDLGGAVIDLAGGMYRVSKSMRIPAGYSNFKI